MYSPIIIALDFDNTAEAYRLTEQLDAANVRLKVGFELYLSAGPTLVRRLVNDGFDVFLDLKFHDIPHTVSNSCRAAADLGVWMMNVHASGGTAMMEAAQQAVARSATGSKLIAVTVLTSMEDDIFAALGYSHDSIQDQVVKLARMAKNCGLDGVVCSAREAQQVRHAVAGEFDLVVPGIRPAATTSDDQHRVASPRQALNAGASYLVIGRPVTRAADPIAAITDICRKIELMSAPSAN